MVGTSVGGVVGCDVRSMARRVGHRRNGGLRCGQTFQGRRVGENLSGMGRVEGVDGIRLVLIEGGIATPCWTASDQCWRSASASASWRSGRMSVVAWTRPSRGQPHPKWPCVRGDGAGVGRDVRVVAVDRRRSAARAASAWRSRHRQHFVSVVAVVDPAGRSRRHSGNGRGVRGDGAGIGRDVRVVAVDLPANRVGIRRKRQRGQCPCRWRRFDPGDQRQQRSWRWRQRWSASF